MLLILVLVFEETLFSIAKAYGVDIEDIQEINPGLIWDLEVGSTIKIPKPDGYLKLSNEIFGDDLIFAKNTPLYHEEPCDKYKYDGKTFNIAILLPFQSKKNYSMNGNSKKKSEVFYKNSDKILEFYRKNPPYINISFWVETIACVVYSVNSTACA